METGWFERLLEVIEAQEMSLRSLSIASGRGPNFISQMIREKKQPGADHLSRVLENFTSEESLYVLTGLRLAHGDLEIIQALSGLSPEARNSFLQFVRSLKGDQDIPAPDAAPSD